MDSIIPLPSRGRKSVLNLSGIEIGGYLELGAYSLDLSRKVGNYIHYRKKFNEKYAQRTVEGKLRVYRIA